MGSNKGRRPPSISVCADTVANSSKNRRTHCIIELVRQNERALSVAGPKNELTTASPTCSPLTLLDGNVMPAQFAPDRITRSDVQSFMKKVSAKPNQEYTEQYPRRMPAKITIRLQDGTRFQHKVQGSSPGASTMA